MIGKLYIVATPIGNLEDITLRAIRILKEVDLIAAEDTRHTLKLLNHLEISKPLISYHRHNEEIRTEELIKELKTGKNIGLVSDAGTPGISDPGEEIIKKCIEESIKVVPIPGACAMINALITSGISTKEFTFLGFLPLNKKSRKEKLEEAYRMVFEDMKNNSPSFFFGNYDAKNGKESFMFGVGTVMEFIAMQADSSEEMYENFSDEFTKNMIKSEKEIIKEYNAKYFISETKEL